MRKIWIILWVVIIFQSCTSKKTDKLAVELKPGIENVIDKYKNQLGVNGLSISYKGNSNLQNNQDTMLTDTVKAIVIVIIDPKKLTKEEAENRELAMEIASSIYPYVLNSDDFQRVDVDFVYDEEYLCNPYYNVYHRFTYEQIENKLQNKNLSIIDNSD